MKKFFFLAAALLVSGLSFGQWALDKSHAKLGFSVSHLLISEVEGAFTSFDARITSAKDDFSDAVIDLTAEIKSINTNNGDRDKHLLTPDFFDAEKFTTLTFKSKSFVKVSGKNYKLTGDLTMHGVTRPVTLDVVFNGSAVHPYSKQPVAGFKISGTLKRSDFGIGTGTPSAVVGDEITLRANAEFIKG